VTTNGNGTAHLNTREHFLSDTRTSGTESGSRYDDGDVGDCGTWSKKKKPKKVSQNGERRGFVASLLFFSFFFVPPLNWKTCVLQTLFQLYPRNIGRASVSLERTSACTKSRLASARVRPKQKDKTIICSA
jgi:hypothetical protein